MIEQNLHTATSDEKEHDNKLAIDKINKNKKHKRNLLIGLVCIILIIVATLYLIGYSIYISKNY